MPAPRSTTASRTSCARAPTTSSSKTARELCILLIFYVLGYNKVDAFECRCSVTELFIGNILSTPNVPSTRRNIMKTSSIKQRTLSVNRNSAFLAKFCFKHFLYTAFVSLLIHLSNDVQINPGPGLYNQISRCAQAQNGLRICHLNIRSLSNTKFEEIRSSLISGAKRCVDVLILTETWLNSNIQDSEIYISGYNIERRDRIGKKGGGVMMYIADDITYNRDLSIESRDLELLCIRVNPYKSNCPLFLVGLYRPDSSSDNTLEQRFEDLYLANKEVIIMGDLNINLLNNNNAKHKIVKYLSNLGLIQLVKKNTRPVSRTCLDHVYSNQPQHILMTKILDYGISDHLPILYSEKAS